MPSGSCEQGIPGQCTELVAKTYPVLNHVPCMGNACQWWGKAQSWGWYSSSNPYVGAVAVWDCGLSGSGGAGHVAIVTTVHNDGTFIVTEENWRGFDVVDTRTVTDRQHISGFFSPPGGPVPGSLLSPGGSQGAVTGPATGARGLRCQFGIQIPQIPLGPATLGPWAVCLDGLIGVLAVAGGIGIIVLGVVLAVRKPAERAAGRATTAVGAATGQPEVMAAGSAVEAQGQQQASQRAPRSTGQRVGAGGATRTPRRTTRSRESVQVQETHRILQGMGYSSVQAARGAAAAGSTGSREERVRRGLRALA